MSSLTHHSVNQKGGIALVVIIIVLVLGLVGGLYLVSQNTSWFSNAGSAQITIPYPSPSPAIAKQSTTSVTVYENPFEASTSYENPFESYKNPFEDL